MSLRDFLNWFEGISENIEAAPTEKQWGRIREKLLALKAATDGGDVVVQAQAIVAAALAETTAAPVPSAPPQKFQRAAPTYPFYIDADGYARRKSGDRILAADVTDILYDLRGMDSDAAAIIWADESTGLNGRDLIITAA